MVGSKINISKKTYGQSSDNQLHEILRIGDGQQNGLGLQEAVYWSHNDEYIWGGGSRSLWSYDFRENHTTIYLDDSVSLTSLVLAGDNIIYANRAGEIILLDFDNNLPIERGLNDCKHRIDISPDEQKIAFIETFDTLKIINITSPNETALRFYLNSFYTSASTCYAIISWSPDGNWLAMAGRGGGVYLLNLDTNEVSLLVQQNSHIFDLSWSSDSKKNSFFL